MIYTLTLSRFVCIRFSVSLFKSYIFDWWCEHVNITYTGEPHHTHYIWCITMPKSCVINYIICWFSSCARLRLRLCVVVVVDLAYSCSFFSFLLQCLLCWQEEDAMQNRNHGLYAKRCTNILFHFLFRDHINWCNANSIHFSISLHCFFFFVQIKCSRR